MGTASVLAATGSGTVSISFRGNGNDTSEGWLGGVAGTTWTTNGKYTVTIDPKTSEKPVTTYLKFRKKGLLSTSTLNTTYYYKGVSYGNTSASAVKTYTMNQGYSTDITENGSYDYQAYTSGVSDAFLSTYVINYSYK